ncbi:hypothetical protein JoomaDRAFT_3236 [Galbibacter orientalis DSM 19592]|uniref:DinB family protein n=1 Tax=Galbibacter orientalis DSM 19592 TaxID=926559 RepID=I3C989_9FLAO|nr:hypothetical protein [Galbibacter orientalis]EIJ40182.1 hypothetical protein JoomaDRAFT_3236 [Galbibacter orientalis DSM 19592]
MIQNTTNTTLNQLKDIIKVLSSEQFSTPLIILNNSSVGMHVRHILEFYQCLLDGIETGIVNYDMRKRNVKLETQPTYCIEVINEILTYLKKNQENIELCLKGCYCHTEETKQIEVKTSLDRELIYNIEHTVHHLAIIRIGINAIDSSITLNDSVGIASSTIRNKNICAQ